MSDQLTPVGSGGPSSQQQPMVRLNTFSNDGSFLEQFKKMQEKQTKKEETQPKVASTRLTKSGTVLMKLSGVKKTSVPAVKLKKPGGSVKKAFSEAESDGEQESCSSNHDNSSQGNSLMSMVGYSGGSSSQQTASSQPAPKPRKRKSRFWDGPSTEQVAISKVISSFDSTTNQEELSAAQKQQLLEQIEMNKLVAEIKSATQPSTNKRARSSKKPVYEYDSDEDTEGGTWEHKKRNEEMRATFDKSMEQTIEGKGKHHIGDFLPPKELDKFIETVSALKEGRTPDFSDYKEHKLTDENVGFKMLQKAGWTEGSGLGSNKEGIVDPINKGKASFDQSGVGAEPPAEVKKEDNDFELYRKRMMLAYRFRPNPLNNPRRPYY